jgi:serine/threonine-protein kinase HipA
MPENENLTMHIAEAFAINTLKSSLIQLQSGELSYIKKCIDQTDTREKMHMLDMFQITYTFDKYKSLIEKIGKALNDYSDNTLQDKLYFLQLAILSFLTDNNDMHLKNFSTILLGNTWTLAPAYDSLDVTIINPDDTEELALIIEGNKRRLKWEISKNWGLTSVLTKNK